jgi:aminoglycoside phosphotransferase (APT) family kinase protein
VLTRIVEAVAPGARVVQSSRFPGGLSSEMTLLDVELSDGSRRRFVVRRALRERGSIPMAVEYRLLQTAWARGLPVPEPLRFDESGSASEQPYMVLGYVDGEPRCTSDDGAEKAGRIADVLASIHALDGSDPTLADLPRRSDAVSRELAACAEPFDEALRERRIVEVLRAHWPPASPDRTALLHCDIWLGNLLWAGSEIVGVIDWENAHVGDPLADVAITRLECAWSFGRDAVDALTDRYVEQTGCDLGALPFWDLAAARRPARELPRWAADWPNYGRPDMTVDRMRAAHRWFVDDALTALGAR